MTDAVIKTAIYKGFAPSINGLVFEAESLWDVSSMGSADMFVQIISAVQGKRQVGMDSVDLALALTDQDVWWMKRYSFSRDVIVYS